MTFMYELDPYLLVIHWTCKNDLCRGFRMLSYYQGSYGQGKSGNIEGVSESQGKVREF